MKPARFDYLRAESMDEALAALSEAGGDARILAGGQSLLTDAEHAAEPPRHRG